jgi:hypothetical protein
MELSKEQATEVLDTFNKWREDMEGGAYLGSDVVTASINFAIAHLRQSSAPAAILAVTDDMAEAGARSIIDGQENRPGTSWAEEAKLAFRAMVAAVPRLSSAPAAVGVPEVKPLPNRREHELKVWPEFWDALASGEKTFELRKDDRGFRAGDVLYLREWNPRSETYSGREMRRLVSYIISGQWGLEKDVVCMALAAPSAGNALPADNSMLCGLCEADRSKEPCRGADFRKCPFTATAQEIAAQPAADSAAAPAATCEGAPFPSKGCKRPAECRRDDMCIDHWHCSSLAAQPPAQDGDVPMPTDAELDQAICRQWDEALHELRKLFRAYGDARAAAALACLRELLEAHADRFPDAEAGQEAQTAWATRQHRANEAAAAILAGKPSGLDAIDAARYREVRMRIGALRDGPKKYPFFTIQLPKAPENVMRGSCAGHFDDAIDAAIATREAGK